MGSSHQNNAHTNAALADVLLNLSKGAAVPFKLAQPITPAVNHSEEFYNHERKSVFMREWICIGRSDEIADVGAFLTHDIAGVPVMAVRQKDETIRAFVNACAHRFACLEAKKTGCTKRFTCQYHAWTYGIDGRLIRAPAMEMKDGFDPDQNGLRPLHLEIWEGFIYITLADDPAHSVADALAPLHEKIVGRYDMGRYKTVLREVMIWDANWKNLIENFTESYHVPFAHQKTFAKHKKPLEDYKCGDDYDHFGYHYAAQSDDTGLGAAHPNNTHLTDEWRRTMVDYCAFPNHLVTLMPDFLWWISVQPLSRGQFRATWGVAIPPEVLADIAPDDYDQWLANLRNYMDIANDEDKILVNALFKGSASPVLPKGTYHPLERNLWQFARYLARMTVG